MKKAVAAAFFFFLITGCAADRLTEEETTLLENALKHLFPIQAKYPELERLDAEVERGVNYLSYSHDFGESHTTPFLNPSYFWFKIALVRQAVDPADLQPPLLTVYIPRFKKYLKLRVTTGNLSLKEDLARGVLAAASEAGGTDPRWGQMDPLQGPRQGRVGRSGRFLR